MQNSKIEWTDHTFNPWQGCSKVSSGCKNCYAETLNNRHLHAVSGVWGTDRFRRRNSAEQWIKPLAWNRKAERDGTVAKVFCASMADVFEDNKTMPLDEWREELHERLILKTPNLHWQLLTKRPENIAKFYAEREIPANVWLGTSVEDQVCAEKRIPALMKNDAPVRFLSCEPLLEPLDLTQWLGDLDWVIVGGESGPGFRPMDADWVRSIRDQCQKSGVPFFFKQWGGRFKSQNGRILDGREWDEFPAVAGKRLGSGWRML